MEAEAEHILEKVKRVRNVAVNGELKQKAVRFMRAHERERMEDELKGIEDSLSLPMSVSGT